MACDYGGSEQKSKILIFLPLVLAFSVALFYVTTSNTSSLISTSTTLASAGHVLKAGNHGLECSCWNTTIADDCSNSTFPVMGGVDFVQYFTAFKIADGTYNESEVGVVGSSEFTSYHDGYFYYFTSQANKNLFDASPSSYIPQWGGFCAWGVAGEYCTASTPWPWSATCLGE